MTECKNSKFPVPEEIKISWRTNGVAEFITIYNRTDGEVWQFHPTHKGSFGRALTEAEAKQFRVWPTNSQTAVGSETIGGHACTKYRVSFEKATDTLRVNFWELREWNREGYVWKANDLDGFPLRIEWHGNHYMITLEIRDVRFGKQPTELFRLPARYARSNRFQWPGWPGQNEVFNDDK